jgi:ribonuclease P protein component
LIVFILKGEDRAPWRLGLAVSKKVGIAVQRNRMKRVVREFFRLHQQAIPAGVDYVVVPKRKVNAPALTYSQLESELGALLLP